LSTEVDGLAPLSSGSRRLVEAASIYSNDEEAALLQLWWLPVLRVASRTTNKQVAVLSRAAKIGFKSIPYRLFQCSLLLRSFSNYLFRFVFWQNVLW